MTNRVSCATCVKDTAMIRIGTGDYCGECGTRADTPVSAAVKPTTTRRSMDMGPARRTTQISARLEQQLAAPRTSTKAAKPVVTSRSIGIKPNPTAAKPAAAIHGRVSPARGGILDLRPVKRPPARAPKATMVIPPVSPYVEHHQAPKLITRDKLETPFKAEHFEDRFERAKLTSKSPAISKFSDEFENLRAHAKSVAHAESMAAAAVPTERSQRLSAAAATHHEALSRLINQMPPVNVPSASSRGGRVFAVTAAVVIMGGYVWLQNYPKMAIQSAGNKAGLTASMPAYVPSSFNLAKTTTQPGLVTLNFSGAAGQGLSIAQHRTDWDSRSLLDNFVSKQDAEYAPVNGQGLTVYLNKSNQATWVNHGVWYSITGATRLSREQILKIAYSL